MSDDLLDKYEAYRRERIAARKVPLSFDGWIAALAKNMTGQQPISVQKRAKWLQRAKK